jgi:hypothetical protein
MAAAGGTTAKSKERAAPAGRARFDIAARARIRAVILRYMEAHRIGVPTLQARISEATDRSIDLIPLKTLQRFLAGATRTNDAFLIPCHQFVSGLPDYAGLQQAGPESLPAALNSFFALPPQERSRQTGPRAAPGEAAGRYEAYAERPLDPSRRMRVMGDDDRSDFSVPYGRLRIHPAAGGSFAADEEVFNPARRFPFDPAKAQERHLYEGLSVERESLTFVLMRNKTTRLPKAYWLSAIDAQTLAGSGIETRFTPGQDGRFPRLVQSLDFAFFRTEEKAS